MPPVMRLLSTDGIIEVEVADPHERSLVIAHWHAVERVLAGDVSVIGDYRGRHAAGYELEADPRRITRWGKEIELDFEGIYAD